VQELAIEGLVKRYPGHGHAPAVDNVDLQVEKGEMLVLLGPSGCGKTTLLRCVAGLENAQEGTISLEGRPVFDAAISLDRPTHLRDIGMVFQNYSLWPHMTVGENVAYPLRARKLNASERNRRVVQMLEIVQCGHLLDRLPAMLSGGQQQRVALARALAPQPKIMLLDEPLSNLDALLRVELRAHLRAIHRELGFTGIYVTHDQIEAFNLGTRVAVMNSGRIEQMDSARNVYERPATEYVAHFLGIRNRLELRFADGWHSGATKFHGQLGLTPGVNKSLNLYLRPNALRLAAAALGDVKPGQVSMPGGHVADVLYSGGETDYVVELGGNELHVSSSNEQAVHLLGDKVTVSFAASNALIYAGGRLLGT
jgi:iron(III) transport system ATP-binding protein